MGANWTLSVPRPTTAGTYVVSVEDKKEVTASREYTVS
jgi:hypothetical protein